MKLRAFVAVITTLIDEAVIVFIILWGLPRLGVNIPLYFTVIITVVFALFCVFTFVFGTKILKTEPEIGFTNMIGMKGYADTDLETDGLVKIKGEIWEASSKSGKINRGEDIIVIGQQNLKLIVKQYDSLQGKGFPSSEMNHQ